MVDLVKMIPREPEGLPITLKIPDGELYLEVPKGWYKQIQSPLPIHWYSDSPHSQLEAYVLIMQRVPGMSVERLIEHQFETAVSFGTKVATRNHRLERTHTFNRQVFRSEAVLTDVSPEVVGNGDGIPYLCWGFSGIEGKQAIYLLQSCEFSDKPLTSEGHQKLTRVWHESFTIK